MKKKKSPSPKSIWFAFLLSIGFTHSVAAQSGIDINAYWLPQTYRILNESDINQYVYNPTPFNLNSFGFSVGFFGKSDVGLEIGYINSVQGQAYDFAPNSFRQFPVTGQYSQLLMGYNKIPVLIKWRSNRYQKIGKGRLGASFGVGAQYSSLNFAKLIDSTGNEVYLVDSEGFYLSTEETYQDHSIDLKITIGMSYGLSKRALFFLNLLGDYSIQNIENLDFRSPAGDAVFTENRLATTYITLGAAVGVSYRLFGSSN